MRETLLNASSVEDLNLLKGAGTQFLTRSSKMRTGSNEFDYRRPVLRSNQGDKVNQVRRWSSCSFKTLIKAAAIAFVFAIGVSQSDALADQSMPHEQLPQSWKADAELTDVFFLNPASGWAVGAQGVILRTTDGGRNWNEISQAKSMENEGYSLRQKIGNLRSGKRTRYSGLASDSSSTQSPVRFRFESVYFVDENNGWVAGGYEIPYVGRSRAIVMRTKDGGLTWESIKSLVIPGINKIHFLDSKNGWAVGRAGNMFATGIFYTGNGGSTWSTKSNAKMQGWCDAVRTSQGFVTLDYDGRIGVYNDGQYDPSVMLGEKSELMNQVRMVDDQNGFAVGDRGTLMKTINGGLSWDRIQFSSEKRLDQMVRQFDLETLSVTPNKIWCAGDPGTFAFSIDRKTGEANYFRLPSNNRVNKLFFIDDQNGWAVGALGSIFATTDGGENWIIQRGTHNRVAMLAISTDKSAVPHELFSKYAGEDSILCSSMLLNSTRRKNQAVLQATERLGCTTSALVEDSKTNELQLENIVRTIRTQQPNVIVCNFNLPIVGASPNAGPAGLIKDAVRMAADRNSFPEQITMAGLKTWQVNRLLVLDVTGAVKIDPKQLLARTGKLMEDQIALSRAIMGQSILSGPMSVFKLSDFTRNNRPIAGKIFTGLAGATVPKRSNANEKHGNLVAIQQASAKQKTFDELIKFEARTPQDLLVWRQQIQSIALRMDSDVAGVWLMQLAEKYLAQGKTQLAAGSTEMLVSRFSEHAFEPAALAWLANYYGSDEFGQLEFNNQVELGLIGADGGIHNDGSGNKFNTAPKLVVSKNVSQLVWVPTNVAASTDPSKKGDLSDGSHLKKRTTLAKTRANFLAQRHLKAGNLLSRLSRRDPELAASEQFGFMDAQLARQISGVIANEGRWQNIVRQDPSGLGLGAHRELIINGFGSVFSQTTPVLNCFKTESRPNLDGRLGDACWNSARAVSQVNPKVYFQQSSSERPDDTVLFAFDDEFLYVAINCQKLPGHYYNSRKSARPRDPDLSRRDRVELAIDVDRDYRSAFKFVVDHRGWVNESCAGSVGWNPEWYVSQSEDEASWTVELAMPLNQISGEDLNASTVWAYGLKRRIFNNQDVWQLPSENGLENNTESGLQIGFRSQPEEFELMRFGQQTSDVSIKRANAQENSLVPTASRSVSKPDGVSETAGFGESKGPFVPLEVTNRR